MGTFSHFSSGTCEQIFSCNTASQCKVLLCHEDTAQVTSVFLALRCVFMAQGWLPCEWTILVSWKSLKSPALFCTAASPPSHTGGHCCRRPRTPPRTPCRTSPLVCSCTSAGNMSALRMSEIKQIPDSKDINGILVFWMPFSA